MSVLIDSFCPPSSQAWLCWINFSHDCFSDQGLGEPADVFQVAYQIPNHLQLGFWPIWGEHRQNDKIKGTELNGEVGGSGMCMCIHICIFKYMWDIQRWGKSSFIVVSRWNRVYSLIVVIFICITTASFLLHTPVHSYVCVHMCVGVDILMHLFFFLFVFSSGREYREKERF